MVGWMDAGGGSRIDVEPLELLLSHFLKVHLIVAGVGCLTPHKAQEEYEDLGHSVQDV